MTLPLNERKVLNNEPLRFKEPTVQHYGPEGTSGFEIHEKLK